MKTVHRKSEEPDEVLLDRYKSREDMEALGELFLRYNHLVLGSCLKILKEESEAQDAVMEIFEELIEKLLKYEVKHFSSWLFRLTHNHCLQRLRKRNPDETTLISEKIENLYVESPDFVHLNDEDAEQSAALERCLEKLNEDQRRCVEDFYYRNLSYKQITERTTYGLKEVKSHIQNGKRNLKNCMSAKG